MLIPSNSPCHRKRWLWCTSMFFPQDLISSQQKWFRTMYGTGKYEHKLQQKSHSLFLCSAIYMELRSQLMVNSNGMAFIPSSTSMHSNQTHYVLLHKLAEVLKQVSYTDPVTCGFGWVCGSNALLCCTKRFLALLKLLQPIHLLQHADQATQYTHCYKTAVTSSTTLTWWKSNTMWALSEIRRRSFQFISPLASFFSSSSNRPGRWITTPLPAHMSAPLPVTYYQTLICIPWLASNKLTNDALALGVDDPTWQ